MNVRCYYGPDEKGNQRLVMNINVKSDEQKVSLVQLCRDLEKDHDLKVSISGDKRDLIIVGLNPENYPKLLQQALACDFSEDEVEEIPQKYVYFKMAADKASAEEQARMQRGHPQGDEDYTAKPGEPYFGVHPKSSGPGGGSSS